MATTWGVVRERIRRGLVDVIRQDDQGNDITPSFSNQELADYWNAAQQELVIYFALDGIAEFEAGATSEALPDDFFKVRWVIQAYADRQYVLHEYDPLSYGDNPDNPAWGGLYWYVQDDTVIRFTSATADTVTMAYAAYYPEITSPDDDNTVISVSGWAVRPLEYYAIAQGIERRIIEDANLRRWASRPTDAGLPTSNPYPQVARWYLDRFREEISKQQVIR